MTQLHDDNTEICVETYSLAYGGDAVGVVTSGPQDLIGKKALVNGAAPGELIRISIIQNTDRLIIARTEEILRASSSRRDPPCPKFGVCGGCQLQHMNIESQRAEKLRMVIETLKIKGRTTPRNPPTLLGRDLPEFNYRRRATFHVNLHGEIGFYRQNSGDIIDLNECLVVSDMIKIGLSKIRIHAKNIAPYIGKITLEDREDILYALYEIRDNVTPTKELEGILLSHLRSSSISTTLSYRNRKIYSDEKSFHFSAGHFIQSNKEANELLVNTVCSVIDSTEVTEYYAGAGNFTIPLALQGKDIIAVEVDGALVQRGRSLAKEAGVEDRVIFSEISSQKYLRSNRSRSCVLLDPPRSGAKEVVSRLNPKDTSLIVYVSCNLPSLCRDTEILARQGYALNTLYVLDMFPQTHHIEIIGEFRPAS